MTNLDDVLNDLNIGVESIDNEVEKLKDSCEEAGMKLHTPETDKVKAEKIFYGLTEDDREQAIREYIIPESYREANFDAEKIRRNLIKQRYRCKEHVIHNYEKYVNICNGILSAIRMRNIPNSSYIIGAPNGFGKTSFVTECLITLRKQGFRAVPYISLYELAEIKVASEVRLMNAFIHPKRQEERLKEYQNIEAEYYYTNPNEEKIYIKKPQIITGRYSFSEYINADCLFVSLSGIQSKDIESHMLQQLLNIRGAKGLPTIVMVSTSLDPYVKDPELRRFIWNEILAYDKEANTYDRLYHVSCYRTPGSRLENKDMNIDTDTGIVLGE